MKDQKFFICNICGKIISQIKETPVPTICCGAAMQEIIPNTVDAAKEKHVPIVKLDADKVIVEVGSVPHPMTTEHLIEWVFLQTKNGGQRKALSAGSEPKVAFALADDEALAVFSYCNLHGLWKTEI